MDLEHGGNLAAAAKRFNIPLQQWIDLSTGISPWSWPVPPVPQSVWQTLPYADAHLERAAAAYYGCTPDAVLAVPGSQYALQYAPALLPRGRVAMPLRGYAEHCAAWTKAGHEIVAYTNGDALLELVNRAAVNHVMLINPNNPTGEFLSRQRLEDIHRRVHHNGGWLVVDEAFADPCPDASLAALCPQPGLIVFRSLGKFFGLAGVRLGFMLAPQTLWHQLEARMPPWLLSHPARWIGTEALRDRKWQNEQHVRLAAAHWQQTLQGILPGLLFSGTALFATGTGESDYCRALFMALGRRALLVRIFEAIEGQSMLRFGLPLPSLREQVVRLIREAVEESKCAIA